MDFANQCTFSIKRLLSTLPTLIIKVIVFIVLMAIMGSVFENVLSGTFTEDINVAYVVEDQDDITKIFIEELITNEDITKYLNLHQEESLSESGEKLAIDEYDAILYIDEEFSQNMANKKADTIDVYMTSYSGINASVVQNSIDSFVMGFNIQANFLSYPPYQGELMTQDSLQNKTTTINSPDSLSYYALAMTLMSGVVISFKEEFDIGRLKNSLLHLLNSQQMLRASIRNDYIILKPKYRDIDLPYLNLKNTSDEIKEKVEDYLTTKYYVVDDPHKKEEHAIHRAVAVKYSENNCKLYLAVQHAVFDGFSAEIVTSEIMKHYYSPETKQGEIRPYQEFVQQTSLGPVNVTRSELLEKLNIKEFSKSLQNFSKNIEKLNLKNYLIELDLGKSSDQFEKEKLWNYAYLLFLRMITFSIDVREVPIGILSFSREHNGKSYHNTIGLFVDLIPIVDSTRSPMDYNDIRDHITWFTDHNISTLSLFSNKRNLFLSSPSVMLSSLQIMRNMDKLPWFNYLGMYESMSNPEVDISVEELLKQEEILSYIVDVKLLQNGFSFLVFCEEGKQDELQVSMQNYLNRLVKKTEAKSRKKKQNLKE